MDLNTLLTELNKYKQVLDCQHCERYPQCMVGTIYCGVLLKQICIYLDDGDEIKRTLKGCLLGEKDWYCDSRCMFYKNGKLCIRRILSEAYNRLATWVVN